MSSFRRFSHLHPQSRASHSQLTLTVTEAHLNLPPPCMGKDNAPSVSRCKHRLIGEQAKPRRLIANLPTEALFASYSISSGGVGDTVQPTEQTRQNKQTGQPIYLFSWA